MSIPSTVLFTIANCRLFIPVLWLPPGSFGSLAFTVTTSQSGRARDLSAHTDLIEPLSLDEAYLDVKENNAGLR
jgi:hypothetical protein